VSRLTSKDARLIRKARVRRNVVGTSNRPRLSVYRGNRHIFTQIIDDTNGLTLVAASSMSAELKGKIRGFTVEAAKEVGTLLAQKAKDKGIARVVFDRGGYRYHGKIKALADAARANGLEF
jgi:large subunit ribosomal protein L18